MKKKDIKIYSIEKIHEINDEINDINDMIKELQDEQEKNILYHYISRKIGERNSYEDILTKL